MDKLVIDEVNLLLLFEISLQAQDASETKEKCYFKNEGKPRFSNKKYSPFLQ